MTHVGARRTATALMIVTLVLLAASTIFNIVDRKYVGYDPGDNLYTVITFAGSLVYLLIGRMIVSRQPANTVGWLLLAIPVIGGFASANGGYATRAFVDAQRSLPLGVWSAWVDRWVLVPTLFAFIPIFLLYPDGRLPSRRWRWVLFVTVGSLIVTTVAFAITPGRMTGALAHLEHVRVANPLGVGTRGGIVDALTGVGGFAILASAILACMAIVVRYRRSEGDVRQQIRWLALVGVTFFVIFGLGLAITLFTHDDNLVGNVMFTLLFMTLMLGIPIACGVAILRYHLYDLDVVVKKTMVFGLLAAFVALVYAAIVAGAGALVGSRSTTALSFVAAAVLAIAFQPVRERARRFADRIVYGKRATPYEVLADFSDRMAETYSTEDVLPRMAQVLANGTGAEVARVWLRVGNELRAEAESPPDASPAAPLPATDGALLEFPAGEHAVDVRHQGELLGALSVRMPPDDPMTPARERLVRDLASQAGLVLRNVGLIEELKASRQRLVAAQDEERRKIERNIHDGAQQQLVALSVQLKLAETMVGTDPNREREMLSRLQSATTDALEDLRDLARGIYPPLLADKGLVAALESQARKSPVPVEVEAAHVGRYPRDVESAVYFCTLEALQNVAKYANAPNAHVRLTQSNGELAFEVRDEGAGFDPATTGRGTGLQGMADRLAALGGTLQLTSSAGGGTVVRGTVPIRA